MEMEERKITANGKEFVIRCARLEDAAQLSKVRWQIDGETQNLDREQGEAFLDTSGFEKLIEADLENGKNLFLVAVADGRIVGFSRCEGNPLKRLEHKAEFGIGVLKAYWGYRIGKNMLKESIAWCDTNGIRKMSLSVLETNKKAIALYEKFGFKTEGILENDKRLSDGHFYNTVIMGRFK